MGSQHSSSVPTPRQPSGLQTQEGHWSHCPTGTTGMHQLLRHLQAMLWEMPSQRATCWARSLPLALSAYFHCC